MTSPKKSFWLAVMLTIAYSIIVGLLIEGYLVQGIDRPVVILFYPWLTVTVLLRKPQRPAYVNWAFRYSSFGFGLASLVRIWVGYMPSLFYPLAIALLLLAFLPPNWMDKLFKPRK